MTYIKSEVMDELRVVVIDVQRLVDAAVIDQCYREILALLERTEEKNFLLHFGRVAFMSSAALGMLVRLNKRCQEFKVSLRLCNISRDILTVFKITSLDKVFSIFPDAADAMAAFKKSGQSFFKRSRDSRQELL